MVDMEFLKNFIPFGEMAVIRENPASFKDELERVERQLGSLPTPKELIGKKLEDIHIWAHYFGGNCDWWVYALEPGYEYAQAFVCLNGDSWNAEAGSLYIPELLPIGLVNLDLYWNTITLKEIMEKVKGIGD